MSKDKRIREMAKDICPHIHSCNNVCVPTDECVAFGCAKRMYEKDYRKKTDVVNKIKTLIHNNTIYPSTRGDVAYISIKSFDGIVQNYLNGLYDENERKD